MSNIQIGDELVINTNQHTVTKNGEALPLPDLTYKLLLSLVKNAPNVVSKEQLEQEVWSGRPVSEETIKQRVSRLRSAIEEDSENPRYLVAVRGQGYRCIATVCEVTPDIEPPQSRPALLWPLVALIIAFVLVGAWYAINNSPNDNDELASTSEYSATDFINQANTYYVRYNPQDNATALSLYQQAITLNPNSSDAYAGLANAYAQGYLQFSKPESWAEQALEMAEKSVILDEKNARAYKALGLALLTKGRLNSAIDANNKSFALAPQWAAPINNNGEIYQLIGQYVAAYKANIVAINIDKKDPIPYVHLGNTFRDLNLPEHANKAYQRSLQLKPDYLLTLNALATHYLFTNQIDLAIDVSKQVIKRHENNGYALYTAGLANLVAGNMSNSEDYFKRAANTSGLKYAEQAKIRLAVIQQNTNALSQMKLALESRVANGEQWPENAYYLALIALNLHQPEDALDYLKRAVALGYANIHWLAQDPMLKALHTNDNFLLIHSQIKQAVRQQRAQVLSLEK